MLIIADTSPLNYLYLIGHIDILPALYDQIVVPEMVITELRQPKTPASVRTWIEDRPDWLDVRQPSLSATGSLARLDDGERDAILLAIELEAELLLLDDRKARAEASRQRFATTGTLGILETASVRGLLSLPEALSNLLTTNFRVAQTIIDDLLARDTERRGGSESI